MIHSLAERDRLESIGFPSLPRLIQFDGNGFPVEEMHDCAVAGENGLQQIWICLHSLPYPGT